LKACILHGPGHVSVEDVPDPRPGPGEALLRVSAAAICHSDIRVYRGQKKARPSVVPGHETAGVIEAVGEGVEGVRPGDRVVVCPILACGHCEFCAQGKRNRCPERRTLGYEEDGGLAELMLIPQSLLALGHVFPVPPGLSLEMAALTEPLACVLNSLETCRLRPGDALLIVGAGPMGLMHLLLARLMGAARLMVTEPDPERQSWAQRLGATEVVDPGREEMPAAALAATGGRGFDAVVVTAGLPPVLGEALASVRRQGVVSLFGGFPPDTSAPFDPNIIHYGEIVLTGSQNATTDQYRRALRLIPRLPELAALLTHRFSMPEATEAYESRLAGKGLKSVVLPGGEL
jgi:L-iditol 2-dehydrogenase